VFKGEAD